MKWIYRIFGIISIALLLASMVSGDVEGCEVGLAAVSLACLALSEIGDIREQMARR